MASVTSLAFASGPGVGVSKSESSLGPESLSSLSTPSPRASLISRRGFLLTDS